MSKFLKSFPTIKNTNRTLYVIISILCMVLATSCDEKSDEVKSQLEGDADYIEFAVGGFDNYVIKNEGYSYHFNIPKEGTDFTMEGIGRKAELAAFTDIAIPDKLDVIEKKDYIYELAAYQLPTDLDNFNFYGEWASVVYESLNPYKFRIHIEANETVAPRQLFIFVNHSPFAYEVIEVYQAGV